VTIPIRIDRTSSVPIHRQLYDALRAAVLSGRLRPAARVPATRELARQLGVARTTVMAAYDQLIADGYLEARRGAWTSVTRDLPRDLTIGPGKHNKPYVGDAAPRITRNAASLVAHAPLFAAPLHNLRYDFGRPFMPAADAFPVREWRRLVTEFWSTSTPAATSAADSAGVPALRQELTRHVRTTRGIDCDADQIIITTGSEQAIASLSTIVLEPGDRVATEDPCSLAVRYLFRSYDADLLPIPVDRDGLVVEELSAIRGRQPVLVHVMPTHQYPTGATLSLRRRLELLRWAEERRALIVEDDYASVFSYEGAAVESLQALDPTGVVAYLGTFAKVLHPLIQIGYLILPPSLVPAARAAHRLTARQAELVHQCVLARFMQEGGLSRYLRRLQRVHVARRDALVQALRDTFGDGVVIGPSASGMQVHVRWPGVTVTADLMDRLAAAGVGVIPVHPLYERRPAIDSGVVMAFASLDEARITSGVRLLGEVLRGA
jgi:GntR family transcriptional regulator / MocR family aminotransferase